MSINEFNQLMEDYIQVKNVMKQLKYQQEFIKNRLHEILDDENTEQIRTPYFELKRTLRYREVIKRDQVPNDIWAMYMENVPFRVLNVKPTP